MPNYSDFKLLVQDLEISSKNHGINYSITNGKPFKINQDQMSTVLGYFLKLFLQRFDGFIIQLKRLRQIEAVDRGLRCKNPVREVRDPGILAVERHHRDGVALGEVTHVVHEPDRDHEDVTLVEGLAVVLVLRVRGYKPYFHGTFYDHHELRRPRVVVRREEAVRGQVRAHEREAEPIEPRHSGGAGDGDGGAVWVRGVSGKVEAAEEEVIGSDCGWVLARC